MTDTINCCGTSEPICPHCGRQQRDGWEMQDGKNYDCEECEKPFRLNVEHCPVYSTEKVCDPGKHLWEIKDTWKELIPGKDRIDFKCKLCGEFRSEFIDSKAGEIKK